jgi:hypothetical protein
MTGIPPSSVKELRPHFLDLSGRVQMELDPPGDIFGLVSVCYARRLLGLNPVS